METRGTQGLGPESEHFPPTRSRNRRDAKAGSGARTVLPLWNRLKVLQFRILESSSWFYLGHIPKDQYILPCLDIFFID